MASIAAYVLQAKGAYRMPDPGCLTFAIFDSVGWVREDAAETGRPG